MPQTRSTSKRIGSERTRDRDEVVPQDSIVAHHPSDGVARPVKKRRVERADPSKVRRRGKRGELCQLNLDVLFIIATYARPLDLLNLARTCKSLRRLLMDKSSAFVWKAARRQFKGLPDCPDDLSEPAYADLAFCTRCHGCGKNTQAVFWNIRRRYCPECRVERLFLRSEWPEAIFRVACLTAEYIDKDSHTYHDKAQVNSLMQEYERSYNKEQFLDDKCKLYSAIYKHARRCKDWQRQMALERKDELNASRQKRFDGILARLRQLGYGAELDYFSSNRFRESRRMSSKPLTDKEWTRILPKWLKTMGHFRQVRLDGEVYEPRRRLLRSEYDNYVSRQAQDAPTFDLLPHFNDLACFPPFRDIINAPEETEMGEKPFEPAFAQLPELVGEWRKQLDTEVAELVRIPPHLSSQDVASLGSSDATSRDKLRLACALFDHGDGILAYPEVLLASVARQSYQSDENVPKSTGSIQARFGIRFSEEAPYIVHACELDPRVTTPKDMDERNARLKCLACKKPNAIVLGWRSAMLHAHVYHRSPDLAPLSELPRWQIVGDEHTDKIQAVEASMEGELNFQRCLMCRPRVGGAHICEEIVPHVRFCHDIEKQDIHQGVHFTALWAPYLPVEMVEGGKGEVIFRKGGIAGLLEARNMALTA